MQKPTVDIYQSEHDGTWVVHIDTDPEGDCNEQGPTPLRVYINDDLEGVYVNPPFPGSQLEINIQDDCNAIANSLLSILSSPPFPLEDCCNPIPKGLERHKYIAQVVRERVKNDRAELKRMKEENEQLRQHKGLA